MAEPDNATAPAPRRSGCLRGFSVGCLAVLVLLAAGIYLVRDVYRKYMDRFEREGYQRIEKQYIEVTERIKDPTIFVGQVVTIRGGSNRGIGLICQAAEIEGDVVGNVHFLGQILTLGKNAHLRRDLDVKAQVLNVYGVVDGKITGVYGELNRKPPATNAVAGGPHS